MSDSCEEHPMPEIKDATFQVALRIVSPEGAVVYETAFQTKTLLIGADSDDDEETSMVIGGGEVRDLIQVHMALLQAMDRMGVDIRMGAVPLDDSSASDSTLRRSDIVPDNPFEKL